MLGKSYVLMVGFGNMGKALAEGFEAKGLPKSQLMIIEPGTQGQAVAKAAGYVVCDSPHVLPHMPHVVVLAVKPQVMAQVAPAYAPLNTLFLSIAAGLDTATLATSLGTQAAIVRAMPNTPAAIGAGMTVLYQNHHVTPQQSALAEELMAAVGATAWITDEALMDAVTAISGSGPAYFFLFMEALAAAGVSEGLPADMAQQLAVQTAYGAACLARQKAPQTTPAALREAVTSPGGTTAAALESFTSGGFHDLVRQAVAAAVKRGASLRNNIR